jgi:hypothetical protein
MYMRFAFAWQSVRASLMYIPYVHVPAIQDAKYSRHLVLCPNMQQG